MGFLYNPEKGSFNHYRDIVCGDFFFNLTYAICHSDKDNYSRLELAYPEIILAHKMSNWDKRPEGDVISVINVEHDNNKEKIKHFDKGAGRYQIEEGCFEWYRWKSGGFVKSVSNAILSADDHNLERISKAFPQMVEAFKIPWWVIPEGFEENAYNARRVVIE